MNPFTISPSIHKASPRRDPTEAEIEGGRMGAVVGALSLRGLLAMVDEVCAARGVLRSRVCSRRRTRAVAWARQEAWWRIRTWPGRSYSHQEIASMWGSDVSTVRAGIARHVARMKEAAG
jgi:hypothetical protein